MPAVRRHELEDALEGCVIEQQSYWSRFTPEDRATVQRAREGVGQSAGRHRQLFAGLRSDFYLAGMTIQEAQSPGFPIIGKLLGHSQPGTTARYSHLDADPMRRAADIIGNQIAAAMEGKRAEVVQLHAKK